MEVKCPHCTKLVNVPPEYTDKPIRCTHCTKTFLPVTEIAAKLIVLPTPLVPPRPPDTGDGWWAFGIIVMVLGFLGGAASGSAEAAASGILGGMMFMAVGAIIGHLAMIAYRLERIQDRLISKKNKKP